MSLTLLDPESPVFPNPDQAASEPDGLLAIGGNLRPETIMSAYYQGIFPWYNHHDPIMWWSPSTRCVIHPQHLHVSKSLKKYMAKRDFTISIDQAFSEVIHACADRGGEEDTWITREMIMAYSELHQLGHAHSLEVWKDNNLIGGIYGLVVGSIFCGESMFSRAKNGSKIALFFLCQHMISKGFQLLDCQLVSQHLLSMGAESISRNSFLSTLIKHRDHQRIWA